MPKEFHRPVFVHSAMGRAAFPSSAIKAAALAFKAKYGEGVGLQNRPMKDSRPWMTQPLPTRIEAWDEIVIKAWGRLQANF